MEADLGQILQGGGLVAFTAALYLMLRDHLRRVESVLSRIDGSLAALEVMVKSIGEELASARRDDTPPARPTAFARARTPPVVAALDPEEFADQPTRASDRSGRIPKVPR